MAMLTGARERIKSVRSLPERRHLANVPVNTASTSPICASDTANAGFAADADQAISQCRDRARVTVAGVIRSVRPQHEFLAVEALLEDENETITLIWLGRRSITGFSEGRAITVRGRIGCRGDERVMYNPAYELRV